MRLLLREVGVSFILSLGASLVAYFIYFQTNPNKESRLAFLLIVGAFYLNTISAGTALTGLLLDKLFGSGGKGHGLFNFVFPVLLFVYWLATGSMSLDTLYTATPIFLFVLIYSLRSLMRPKLQVEESS